MLDRRTENSDSIKSTFNDGTLIETMILPKLPTFFSIVEIDAPFELHKLYLLKVFFSPN